MYSCQEALMDPTPSVAAPPRQPLPPPPRLLDQLRDAARARRHPEPTVAAFVAGARRFVLFHHNRRPGEMGAAEVEEFLTRLAVAGHVAASTQDQALNALLFLYAQVLEIDLGRLDAVRARRGRRLPVVCPRGGGARP